MTSVVAAGVRLVLLVLAVLLPSALPAGVARPDLVLLVVAATALLRGPTTGLLVGLAGGWLVDLVPPGAEPIGASALVYAAAGALLGLARRHVVVSPLVPWLVTVGVAGLVLGLRWVGAAGGFGTTTATDLLWSWAVTAVTAMVLLPVLTALERGLRGRDLPDPGRGPVVSRHPGRPS